MDGKSHLGRRLLLLTSAMLIAIFGATSASFALDIESDGLRTVHEKTAARYPSVRQMSAVELDLLRKIRPDELLIIDVRELSEYAVSRIKGAVRVMPGIAREDFLRLVGQSAKDRTVILYCSVGVRSMQLADRVQDAVKKAGALDVYNLAGGVFNWHNQSRSLTGAKGTTEYIHPYNRLWSRLVERRNLIRYDIGTSR